MVNRWSNWSRKGSHATSHLMKFQYELKQIKLSNELGNFGDLDRISIVENESAVYEVSDRIKCGRY